MGKGSDEPSKMGLTPSLIKQNFFFSQELVFYLTHLEKVILKWYSDNWKVETTSYK